MPHAGGGTNDRGEKRNVLIISVLLPIGSDLTLRSTTQRAIEVLWDFHGDHTSTCTAHSGATKAHDWMVSVIGPLFRTAGHVVRTQHGVTASAGQRRGDVEIGNYLRDQAGSRWSLVFDLSIAHDRFGSSSHVSSGAEQRPEHTHHPVVRLGCT